MKIRTDEPKVGEPYLNLDMEEIHTKCKLTGSYDDHHAYDCGKPARFVYLEEILEAIENENRFRFK